MFVTERFRLPRDAQSKSRLLQLPAEIRMMIYEYLLVPRRSIRSVFEISQEDKQAKGNIESRHLDEMRKQTHLSSQLLRCCQMLLKEGHPLVYNNTELSIYCRDGNFHILDAQIPIDNPDYGVELPRLDVKLQELSKGAQVPLGLTILDNPVYKPCHFLRIMKCVSKFDHYNIIIHERREWRMRRFTYSIYAYATRNLVSMKAVRLSVRGHVIPRNASHRDLSLRPSAPGLPEFSLLRIFKVWRCRSLLICKTQADERTKIDVVATVTGKTPVYELIMQRKVLDDEMRTGDIDLVKSLVNRGKQTLCTRFREAAYSGNLTEYLHAKDAMQQATRDVADKRIQKMFDEASNIQQYPR